MNERQGVTIGVFAFAVLLLGMAWANPALWEVEVFKVIVQAVVLTGMLNMVLAFHFSSNTANEKSTDNTGAAFRAIEATATGQTPSSEPHGLNDPSRPAGTSADPVHVEQEAQP